MLSIYYNDYDNTFEDMDGNMLYDISNYLPIEKIMKYKQIGGTYYSSVGGDDFEIVFPIRDNYRLIAYYQETNTFLDEEDVPIFNIFDMLKPNDVFMFKKNKKNAVIKGVQDRIIDLLYI